MNDGRGDQDYEDICDASHGTGVAAIVAGNRTASYLGGVAPRALLVICRIAQTMGGVNENHVADALNWIYEHNEVVLGHSYPDHEQKCDLGHGISLKISIINMSLCLSGSTTNVETVIEKLQSQEVLCIAGAGNGEKNEEIGYPANSRRVLSIGAATISGEISVCSSTNKKNIYALGEDVCLARKPPTSPTPLSQTERTPVTATSGPPLPRILLSYTEADRGTSYAAPAVSGLAALLLQLLKRTSPEKTNFGLEIKNIIESKMLADKHYHGLLLQPEKIVKYFEGI
jgi:subtilisin family serine protease